MKKVIIDIGNYPPKHSFLKHLLRKLSQRVTGRFMTNCARCEIDMNEQLEGWHFDEENKKWLPYKMYKLYKQHEKSQVVSEYAKTIPLSDIETLCETAKNKNFSGRIYYSRGPPGCAEQASINPHNEIRISIDPKNDRNSTDRELQEYISKCNIQKPYETMLEHTLLHEITHTKFKGLENYLSKVIKRTVKKEMKNGDRKNNKAMRNIDCLARSLADIIVDSSIPNKKTYPGMWLLDYRDYCKCKDNGQLSQLNYDLFFQAYTAVKLFLYGSKPGQKLTKAKHYISMFNGRIVQNFIKRLGLRRYDHEYNENYLTNKKNWKELGRVFAEEFYKLT